VYDVVVGINLLREGLDLPEVSLVCILDADKEGYLRSGGSLIQTIGRASRHVNGHVIMYADVTTDSMQTAINETYRRRSIQLAYNEAHGISPVGIQKAIRDITDHVRRVAEEKASYSTDGSLPKEELVRMIIELEKQMKNAAKALEFEKAAALRDQVIEFRRALVSDTDSLKELAAVAGQDGVLPFTDSGVEGGRRMRGVSYRPGRRGARYRR
jgi:excinuclease ABC subunit B